MSAPFVVALVMWAVVAVVVTGVTALLGGWKPAALILALSIVGSIPAAIVGWMA